MLLFFFAFRFLKDVATRAFVRGRARGFARSLLRALAPLGAVRVRVVHGELAGLRRGAEERSVAVRRSSLAGPPRR